LTLKSVVARGYRLLNDRRRHRFEFVVDQDSNQPCWDLFQRLGFVEVDEGVWSVDGEFNPTKELYVSVQWEEQSASSR